MRVNWNIFCWGMVASIAAFMAGLLNSEIGSWTLILNTISGFIIGFLASRYAA